MEATHVKPMTGYRTDLPADRLSSESEVLNRDPATEDAGGETKLYILSFSKMDPELRASIVGDWSPPEETPEERAARLEWAKAATAEYDAEFGPLTPEEKAWADAILDGSGDWMDEP